jgi:S-adenosylmethionine:tRNA ribosyltransferase-isomerase
MRTDDFDYHLPKELIAQRPARPRDTSRLLVLDRSSGGLSEAHFYDLPRYLRPHDALVVNRTRVIPSRLAVRKIPGGGRAELLLLERLLDREWRAMVGGNGLRAGRRLQVQGGPQAEILEDLGGALRRIRFAEPIAPRLSELGEIPLPPYINTPLQHPDEYQTIFARDPGSAAAPTAGLHFTPRLLRRLQREGAHILEVTLHIGLDTFAPVHAADIQDHPIHTEWCQVTEPVARAINEARARGGRIIAVGTTVVRALESSARASREEGKVAPFEGATDLFIVPGHPFRAVDALITNFHLPRSTLLMLVSAFAGRERILAAYQFAIDQGYRFYSFGDAMLIL